MKTTLVIMAAGMGSRYGGDKQTDGVGPHREVLMEYSIYDALRAGFEKIVFVIRPGSREMLERFVGGAANVGAELCYVYQDFSRLPEGFHVPAERKAPFGTGHALLCAAEAVKEPFCVINADDYYGPEAFRTIHDALVELPPSGEGAMVGFILGNTLSKSGTVSRGVCRVKDGYLEGITERLKIGEGPDGVLRDGDDVLDRNAVASMNIWGFTPSMFDELRAFFADFLRTRGQDPKAECQLPVAVSAQMGAGKLRVRVLKSPERWFGMTYREDRAHVEERLRELHAQGVYPEDLWERHP